MVNESDDFSMIAEHLFIVNPYMDYFPKNKSSGDYGQWVINYHEHYKGITNKDYSIKYLLHQCSTKPLEDVHYRHFPRSVTFFCDGIYNLEYGL